jgi:hypothetical protein
MKEIDIINRPDHQELIDVVLKQIQYDIEGGDVDSIEEMLKFVPIFNLVSYLPDKLFNKFKYLMEE